MKKEGFSSVELLVVFAIIGIIASLSVSFYSSWAKKYYIEKDIKELFADLLKTRILAMDKNLGHFVLIQKDGYRIYEDADPAPFGDGRLDVEKDRLLFEKEIKSSLSWSGQNIVEFNSRGLSNTAKTLCVISELNPAFDCIKISRTQIRIGKLKKQECSADNCEPKR